MSVWVRLGIPILLAVSAGLCNWYAVFLKVKPVELATVKWEKKRGQTLSAADITIMQVHVEPSVRDRFIRAEQVGAVLDWMLTQDIQPGQPLVFSDLTSTVGGAIGPLERPLTLELSARLIGEEIYPGDRICCLLGQDGETSIHVLGPFRVLDVRDEEHPHGNAASSRIVTVAIRLDSQNKLEPNSERLVSAYDELGDERILKVVRSREDGDTDAGNAV